MSSEIPRPVEPSRDHVAGEVSADAAIVQYGDYACGICAQFERVMKQVLDQSGRPVKYVFRHLPLAVEGSRQLERAVAAEAAARQGRFWEMHTALFRNYLGDHEQVIQNAARDANLDLKRFERDRADPTIEEEVRQDIAQAEAHGIDRVPTLFIRGREYAGVWDAESLQEAVNPPLAKRVQEISGEFARWAAGSSLVLVVFAVIALVWKNSWWSSSYADFWHIKAGLAFGGQSLMMSLHHWVNDLLMSLFFLVVGLELKRELSTGELSNFRQALPPIAAAVGGMVVPVAIYLAFNVGAEQWNGWGVPMATDIAFTLGILALLGSRVPKSLKVFATALAIVDDLGAILILAVAYNHGLAWDAIAAAGVLLLLLVGLNRMRVYALWPYMFFGVGLWFAVFYSGLHATIAGVLLAATIPTKNQPPLLPILAQSGLGMRQFARIRKNEAHEPRERRRLLRRVRAIESRIVPPAERLEHLLQPWSTWVVLPVFALANAGMLLSLDSLNVTSSVSLGIIAGLVVGKPLGIFLGAWSVDKLGIGQKPSDANWIQVLGVGALCGIGFTMAIFIANEAFQDSDQLQSAKLAVMTASVLAAGVGLAILRFGSSPGNSHN